MSWTPGKPGVPSGANSPSTGDFGGKFYPIFKGKTLWWEKMAIYEAGWRRWLMIGHREFGGTDAQLETNIIIFQNL